MPNYYLPVREIQVYCKYCREWLNEKDVEFVDISEGFTGEDWLTFKCPECGTTQESLRRG